MRASFKYIGLFLWIFGIVGGCEIINSTFGIDWFDNISKDQIITGFGMTWFFMERRN